MWEGGGIKERREGRRDKKIEIEICKFFDSNIVVIIYVFYFFK